MNIRKLFILTAFQKDSTLADNIKNNKELIKFLNLWRIDSIETVIHHNNMTLIGYIVDEKSYNLASKYMHEMRQNRRLINNIVV